jgi:hypothetical protein
MLIISKKTTGIQANKVLNTLADKVEKLYKTSKNLKFGFDMGYDAEWEYVIENTKTNKAIVLKQHPQIPNKQLAFMYMRSFSTQHSEDVLYDIKNKDLVLFIQKSIPYICK